MGILFTISGALIGCKPADTETDTNTRKVHNLYKAPDTFFSRMAERRETLTEGIRLQLLGENIVIPAANVEENPDAYIDIYQRALILGSGDKKAASRVSGISYSPENGAVPMSQLARSLQFTFSQPSLREYQQTYNLTAEAPFIRAQRDQFKSITRLSKDSPSEGKANELSRRLTQLAEAFSSYTKVVEIRKDFQRALKAQIPSAIKNDPQQYEAALVSRVYNSQLLSKWEELQSLDPQAELTQEIRAAKTSRLNDLKQDLFDLFLKRNANMDDIGTWAEHFSDHYKVRRIQRMDAEFSLRDYIQQAVGEPSPR